MEEIISFSDSEFIQQIKMLEDEISILENKLKEDEALVDKFESQIRAHLHHLILRLKELTDIYKALKRAKKEKRNHQKKKGKNYKAHTEVPKINSNDYQKSPMREEDKEALRRLYKEAIVQVHPDKFIQEGDEKVEKATTITVQLNSIYKSGNLDQLIDFHEHILSGNAMAHVQFQSENIPDAKAMVEFLQKKRKALITDLENIHNAYTYQQIKDGKDFQEMLEELKVFFEYRIKQFEKRTRKRKG